MLVFVTCRRQALEFARVEIMELGKELVIVLVRLDTAGDVCRNTRFDVRWRTRLALGRIRGVRDDFFSNKPSARDRYLPPPWRARG
jgi:hypothetical protein